MIFDQLFGLNPTIYAIFLHNIICFFFSKLCSLYTIYIMRATLYTSMSENYLATILDSLTAGRQAAVVVVAAAATKTQRYVRERVNGYVFVHATTMYPLIAALLCFGVRVCALVLANVLLCVFCCVFLRVYSMYYDCFFFFFLRIKLILLLLLLRCRRPLSSLRT